MKSGGSNIPVKDVNEWPFATGMLSNQHLSLAVVFSVEWLSVFSTSSSLSFTEMQKPTGLQLCHHFGYRNSYILLNERGRIKMKGSGAENKVKLIHQKCIQLFIYFYLLVFILYTDIYGYKYICLYDYGPYMCLGEEHKCNGEPIIPTPPCLIHIKCPLHASPYPAFWYFQVYIMYL